MTFNIRYGLANDGQNSWENRKNNVADLIKYHQAEIIGLQEALDFQLAYLDSSLAQYSWFGAAREDGKQKGEFTAILYNTSRLTLVHNFTFWLSKTPGEPSLGWDAAHTRTVTWALFRDNISRKEFLIFNTHFDHKGEVARLESAKLLKQKINEITEEKPFILTGDFNCKPSDEPYLLITGVNNQNQCTIHDTQLLSKTDHYGPKGTFTAFNINAAPNEPIDFIFAGDNITVKSHATLADSFDGRLPSDHYPVLVELYLD